MILKIYLYIALIIYLFLVVDLNNDNLLGAIECLIAVIISIFWLPIIIIEGVNNVFGKKR